jgi:hypothetical protein
MLIQKVKDQGPCYLKWNFEHSKEKRMFVKKQIVMENSKGIGLLKKSWIRLAKMLER